MENTFLSLIFYAVGEKRVGEDSEIRLTRSIFIILSLKMKSECEVSDGIREKIKAKKL